MRWVFLPNHNPNRAISGLLMYDFIGLYTGIEIKPRFISPPSGFLDIFDPCESFKMHILRPKDGIIGTGGGQDDAICHWQF